MKKSKLIFKKAISKIFVLGVLSAVIFTSCKKDEDPDVSNLLASEVVGTYTGTLKNSTTNVGETAIITVTIKNDSLIQLHCMADNFDSTIILQLYQNYDSIMVCFTGQNFYNEYGHNTNNYDFCNSRQSGWMNNNWMNDGNHWMNHNTNWGNTDWAGNDQWNAWTNHMNTQHNQNDLHYGGFNPSMNSCNYRFQMSNGNTHYYEFFTGVKNN